MKLKAIIRPETVGGFSGKLEIGNRMKLKCTVPAIAHRCPPTTYHIPLPNAAP
jgi:hypothetical protein